MYVVLKILLLYHGEHLPHPVHFRNFRTTKDSSMKLEGYMVCQKLFSFSLSRKKDVEIISRGPESYNPYISRIHSSITVILSTSHYFKIIVLENVLGWCLKGASSCKHFLLWVTVDLIYIMS